MTAFPGSVQAGHTGWASVPLPMWSACPHWEQIRHRWTQARH
jgi:hypothetical protein